MKRTLNILRNMTNERYANIKEKEILSVIIDSQFKTIVFVKDEDRCYIAIGDTTPYEAKCYWNNASITGLGLINTSTAAWYEVSKDEGNAIYAEILATKKTGKNGKPFYRWRLPSNLLD